MKKLEYSQIVRRKLKALRVRLTDEFGSEAAGKALKLEMFDDREDFMYKLFGISSTSQESLEYWDE